MQSPQLQCWLQVNPNNDANQCILLVQLQYQENIVNLSYKPSQLYLAKNGGPCTDITDIPTQNKHEQVGWRFPTPHSLPILKLQFSATSHFGQELDKLMADEPLFVRIGDLVGINLPRIIYVEKWSSLSSLFCCWSDLFGMIGLVGVSCQGDCFCGLILICPLKVSPSFAPLFFNWVV